MGSGKALGHEELLSGSLASLLFVDTVGALSASAEDHIYYRASDAILGLEEEQQDPNQRLCFNCGSPDHAVSSCPDPLDRQLIALSRQLFNFFHASGQSSGETERFHVVESWRQQRLEWLDTFEPGQIRGELLRDALGLRHEDSGESVEWLRSMAVWGYPKGWTGEEDPQQRMHDRICFGIDRGSDDEENDNLLVFGEDGVAEGEPTASIQDTVTAVDSETETESSDEEDDTNSTISNNAREQSTSHVTRRWASYPPTFFSSSLLPIYNGFALPPIDMPTSERKGPTYSADRNTLWTQIVSNTPPSAQSTSPRYHQSSAIPPWRLPGAFSAFGPVGWTRTVRQVPHDSPLRLDSEIFEPVDTGNKLDDDDMDLSD